MMKPLRVLLLTAAILFGCGLPCLAQTGLPPNRAPAQSRPEEKSPQEKEQETQMQKARNKQRYEQLKRDSDRLLQLATELKKYVDQADENVLSLEIVRKAEEMEKLARAVKNKMRE